MVKQLFTVLLNQKRVSFHQKQLMKRHPQSLRSTLFILNRPGPLLKQVYLFIYIICCILKINSLVKTKKEPLEALISSGFSVR